MTGEYLIELLYFLSQFSPCIGDGRPVCFDLNVEWISSGSETCHHVNVVTVCLLSLSSLKSENAQLFKPLVKMELI